jgi:predicted RNA-binding Zn-ribbon protein involved in translation (DUF1610 family)
MGRSYLYECPRCGYRARVSGRAENGVYFAVETVACRDCGELHDAVTRVKVPDLEKEVHSLGSPARRSIFLKQLKRPGNAPSFQAVLNRLPFKGAKRFKWLRFTPQCPVNAFHRVQVWRDPGQCPKCGAHLERGALPYRLWD